MWLRTTNSDKAVRISNIPKVTYDEFFGDVTRLLGRAENHIGNYFAIESSSGVLRFFMVLLNDADHEILIGSFEHQLSDGALVSIAAKRPQILVFEREISERFGVEFTGSPWAKPLRFPFNRHDPQSNARNYPFFTIDGQSLHEVNVGPIHAGIIEPGVFRFICNGEQVLHLEIVLGFQHRGIEAMMYQTQNRLRQTILAESIAGDNSVGHAVCWSETVEKLMDNWVQTPEILEIERTIGLELERVAMHFADTSALCADIGYQLGQVACEALRTIVINTTQLWCGNRFGKGLVRPGGTNYPINEELISTIRNNIAEVVDRYDEVRHDLKTTSSVLARFEECGAVPEAQAQELGLVGIAGRSANVARDLRISHPWGAYKNLINHAPIIRTQGDVMARLMVRTREVEQSAVYINILLDRALDLVQNGKNVSPKPSYETALGSEMLSVGLVEGWRGEICHVALTDNKGEVATYKIKDPSMHNWFGLAVAVRGGGISDFPICNKSFNLSYCGHDL